MLSSHNRLRAKKDFSHVFVDGKSVREGSFTLKVLMKKDGEPRFAFVVPVSVSKKSSVRNAVRRKMRAVVRTRVLPHVRLCDGILFAYKGAEHTRYAAMEEYILRLCKRANILP